MSGALTLARELVTLLTSRGETLAGCESLTAGLLCAQIASVPGASVVLRGGLVTYSTELKHDLAGVPQEVLDAVGPVAKETAEAMARGARERCGATWGLSFTGVAGPDPQDGHDVGEVWIGLDREGMPPITRHLCLDGGDDPHRAREYIRCTSVERGMELLIETLGTIRAS